MNYGKTEVSRKLRRISSKTEKLTSRMIFLFVKLILVAVLLMAAFAASLGYGALKGIIDSAPEIDVASIEPSGYATIVIALCFMFAVLFLIIGIIGEYISVIFKELKDRPIYILSDLERSETAKALDDGGRS